MKIIKEQGRFRTNWDLLILILIVISILLIPFQFAIQHKVTFVGSLIVYAIDFFFIIDIFLNAQTSFKVAGREISDRVTVKNHYFKTNLRIDFLATLPIDLLFILWPGFEFVGISLVIWLRLLRLLRVQHLFVILKRWQNHNWVNPGYLISS